MDDAIEHGRGGWFLLVVAVAFSTACGKSVHRGGDDSPARGGAAGNATGGRGGTQGGLAGAMISGGGRAAAGGRSGSGGEPGGAGCRVESVENSLEHCPSSVSGRQSPQYSTCDFDSTCEALGCGEPWSDFDARGCLRPTCRSSDDCGADERCVPAVLAGRLDCFASVFEWCDASCSECQCSSSSDCIPAAFCQPATEFPASGDCQVENAPCDDIGGVGSMLELYLQDDYTGDTALALEACENAVSARLADCGGGAAGAGGE